MNADLTRPGPGHPVPYSLTPKAEAELAAHEPEPGCLPPAPDLQATPARSAPLEAPEPEAGR